MGLWTPLHRYSGAQKVRSPGIEPGPSAWKADILTTELRALLDEIKQAAQAKSLH